MAQKTYYGLKYRNETLVLEDTLVIHGIEYQVDTCGCLSYLHAVGKSPSDNDVVFRNVFGLTKEEIVSWAKKFGSTGCGFFPEFKNNEDLRRFVIDIYEKPEYNVGDYVTILERAHDGNDYPASFTNSMTDYCGKTFVIKRVNPVRWNIEEVKLCGGEPHLYDLEDVDYNWHPSMFRKATESEIEAYKKSNGESKVDYKSGIIKVDAGLDVSKVCPCSGSSSSIASSLEDSRATLDRMMETIRSFKPYSPVETAELRDSKLRLPKDINKTPHINL